MNRVAALHATPLVWITGFDHPPAEAHVDPEEEAADTFSVNFVERGRFDVVAGGRRYTVDERSLFLVRPAAAFRCLHDSDTPDDVCISLDVAPALAADVVAAVGPGPAADGPPVAGLTNRLGFLRLALIDAARNGADAVAAETLGAELLAAALGPASASRPFRPGQLAWYARRVRAARECMDADSAHAHTLGGLAREAGMSPFHFARVFRELAGTPPHRYLRALRLRRAAALLAAGASVTETCFASGFRNLGHFSRSFRRAFGVPPSGFCASPPDPKLSAPSRGASRG